MPAVNNRPAAGTAALASAQVLLRKNIYVVGSVWPFGPVAGGGQVFRDRAIAIRGRTAVRVNNLSAINITVYLYPQVTVAGIDIPARTGIQWRPVGFIEGDRGGDLIEATSGEYLPLLAPVTMPIGAPINTRLDVTGLDIVAIEIKTPGAPGNEDGAREQIMVSITAAQ